MWRLRACASPYAARKKLACPQSASSSPRRSSQRATEQVAEFRKQSEDIAFEVDISELWGGRQRRAGRLFIRRPCRPLLGLGHHTNSASRPAAMPRQGRLYFEDGKTGYTPRAPDAVEETLARRNRQAQQAEESDDLVVHLQRGVLPAALTPHQKMLIDSMRDYAAFGDDYTRSALVKALLNKMERSTGNLQRLAFDVLVTCGEFAPDEPIELVRDDIATEFSDDALAAAEIVNETTLLDDLDRTDLTALPHIHHRRR